jgi:hypothetical protein
MLLLPEDGFPGASRELKDAIAAAWGKGEIASAVPSGAGPTIVVLASAEDPALFGARLRSLARDPSMKGKLLAVWPLGGPVRGDLPASLLAEGNLAALGIAEYSPLGIGRVAGGIKAYAAALAAPGAHSRRPEDLAGPFVWYY